MRNDQIFTPAPIVAKMLDKIEYFGDNIKTKTIFEPSFGAGAFLKQITYRILDYAKENSLTNDQTIAILDNVHGVEIDKDLFNNTKKELIEIVNGYGINYEWKQLKNADTTMIDLCEQYDLCIGNPPYVSCWNYSEDDRKRIESKFMFANGNTDLYIVFFELCINALKKDGRMCFITPNSFLRNTSQKDFRQYLVDGEMVVSIDDYATVPVFGKVATYTAITLLDKNGNHTTTSYSMMKDIETVAWTNNTKLGELGSKQWAIANESDEIFLKNIRSRKTKLADLCTIQYGLATNADQIYIVDKDSCKNFESEILRPVIKGSTLASEQFIIFPYLFNTETNRYDLIDEGSLREHYPKTYQYLLANRDRLMRRDLEKNAVWYQYGRSQGIQNSNATKIVLKHIVSANDTQCAFVISDDRTLVYSGMFITVRNESDMLRVVQAIISDEFCRYVKLVGKNMSGGYKSFNTTAVKNFGIKEGEEKSNKDPHGI